MSRSEVKDQGPVVQSIISLTMSLKCQFIKSKPTTLSNTMLFFVEKCENLLQKSIYNIYF